MSDTLPPLPEFGANFRPRWPSDEGGYSADQMRSYAAAALAAERERQHEQMRQLMSELIFDEPAAVAEPVAWREVLLFAEAALADIGDADREPGDDLAWCEARAAEALPRVREALMRTSAPAAPPQREPLTEAQAERLYQNIKPSQQQDARSCAAFKRLVRVVEGAHDISAPSSAPKEQA